MILYFSGTGNSELIASRLAKEVDDEIINLFDKIQCQDYSIIDSKKPWIIVTPTYAWRIPRIVNDWLKKTQLNGHQDIYFVMSCAGSKGNADKYLKKLAEYKGQHYKGCKEVIMPENYIALFDTTPSKKVMPIIDKGQDEIVEIAQYIKQNQNFPQVQITMKDKLNSGIVNDVFYPLFVHDKKFYATDACITCGKCVQVCPLKNIKLVDGKPLWQGNCTHCMACIAHCPKAAIEYGQKSIGKERYLCPK